MPNSLRRIVRLWLLAACWVTTVGIFLSLVSSALQLSHVF